MLKIVYVDDEVDLCELAFEMYKGEGRSIVVFSEALKALEYLMREKPDLLFVDYRMPGLRGDELVAKLPYQVPTYLVTGELDVNTKFQFDGILCKPDAFAEIDEIIKKFKLMCKNLDFV